MNSRATTAALALALSCTEPNDRAVGSVNFPTFADGQAGVPAPLAVQVLDRNGSPKRDARVRWMPRPGAGTVSFAESVSDYEGIARTEWTPGATLGANEILVDVEQQHAQTIPVTIRAGFVSRVELVDSVRLTRRDARGLRLSTFDKFDNEHLPPSFHELSMSLTGRLFAGFSRDSLFIGYAGKTLRDTGTLFVRLRSDTTFAVAARIKVTVDIVIASLEMRGVDSNYIAVGQTLPYLIIAEDSGGVPMQVSPAEAGVVVTSSDSSIVGVDAAGQLIGRKAGFATVTASIDSITHSARVEVIPAYDLGAIKSLYDIPPRTNLFYNEGPSFTANGRSVFFEQDLTFAQTTVAWFAAGGDFLGYRGFPSLRKAGVTAAGAFFLTNPLTYTDSAGRDHWTRPFDGEVTADSTTFVVSTPSGLVAFAMWGDSLWSVAGVDSNAFIMLAPRRVYVWECCDRILRAFGRDGTPQWSKPLQEWPILTDDASRVFAADSQSVVAIDSTGVELWRSPIASFGVPTLVVAQDNALIVHGKGVLHALDRGTGAVRWSVNMPSGASLTTAGDRVLAGNVYIHVFDLVTGQRLGRTVEPYPVNGLTCTAAGLAFWAAEAVMYPRCR